MTDEIRVPGSHADLWGTVDTDSFAALLKRFGVRADHPVLLNCSENATFRMVCEQAGPAILRLYRVGHRTRDDILSELAWMDALRSDVGISTPAVVTDERGVGIHEVETTLGPTFAVVFNELPGQEPPEAALVPWFHKLGALCARLHEHARTWRRPDFFVRPVLTWQSLIGVQAIWGSWSEAPGLERSAVPLLERLAAQLAQSVGRYGMSADRYGVIHGDLRLQNLLVEDDRVHLIDFDDCATCWYLYDLATALSLLEDLPEAPDLLDAWINGYESVQPLRPEDRRIIPDLIMMRRIQVLGWFGSRRDTEMARQWAPQYVPATVAAAEEFLSGRPKLRPHP